MTQSKPTNYSDIIVVGGGISGLYSAYAIKKRFPQLSILLLERNPSKWIGGRIGNDTFYGAQVVTGAGIGRKKKDVLLTRLLDELQIQYSEFQVDNSYAKNVQPLDINSIMRHLRREFKKNGDANTKTFKSFATEILGAGNYKKFVIAAGYTDFENEDVFETLYHYGMEDNAGGWTGMYIPWKQLIQSLCARIGETNIRSSSNVQSIESVNNQFHIETEKGAKYICNRVILATPIDAIHKLIPESNRKSSIYQQIHGQPFVRIYGKFAKASIETMKEYVPNTTVVSGALHKIIPIQPDAGIYMIAYSDNKGALELKDRLENTKANREFYQDLLERSLSMPRDSLKLIAIADYYWDIGTHYYSRLTGPYTNRREFIRRAQHPMDNMLIVGEMISTNQGWVEGALESVEAGLTDKWLTRK